MNSKLVSIITPSYNSEKFISETIKSVLNQTYKNWEMLITDDGSTDNSYEIINKICEKDSRIKLFSIKNAGPAVARNNSIKHAKGKYVAFLDSDDLWFSEFLSKSINCISKSEGFVFSSYKRCNEITLKEQYKDFIVPKKVTYMDILKTNSISCLTAFIDIEKLGKEYMPEVLYRQDMGLWLKYLKKINYAKGIKETLAIYRIRDNSHSRNKKKLLKPQWYFYRHVENLSFITSIYLMIVWAYRGFKKYS
jgi:glycosyltransferase involved in cell wall biosynthesis